MISDNNSKPRTPNSERSSLWQYAGMASQFLVSIGIGVFIGYKIDQWMDIKIPLLVWLLPLLIIIGMIVTIAKQSKKND